MYLDNDVEYPKAVKSVFDLIDEIEPYMGEFALGSETYTLGDVLITSFLARLRFGTDFFDREVRQNRPKLHAYWLRMLERPSAKQLYFPAPMKLSTLPVAFGLVLVSIVMGLVAFGVSSLFAKPSRSLVPAFGAGFFFFVVSTLKIVNIVKTRTLRATLGLQGAVPESKEYAQLQEEQ